MRVVVEVVVVHRRHLSLLQRQHPAFLLDRLLDPPLDLRLLDRLLQRADAFLLLLDPHLLIQVLDQLQPLNLSQRQLRLGVPRASHLDLGAGRARCDLAAEVEGRRAAARATKRGRVFPRAGVHAASRDAEHGRPVVSARVPDSLRDLSGGKRCFEPTVRSRRRGVGGRADVDTLELRDENPGAVDERFAAAAAFAPPVVVRHSANLRFFSSVVDFLHQTHALLLQANLLVELGA